jgi:DNA-binding phage protein
MPDRFDLSDMEFDEVSLCPEGDNISAKVALAKTAPSKEEKKPFKERLMEFFKTELEDEEEEVTPPVDDKSGNVKPSGDTVGKQTTPGGEESVPTVKTDEEILKSLPDEARSAVEAILKAKDEKIEELETEVEELEAEAEDDEEEDDNVEKSVQEILKTADPVVRTLIEKMQADTAEAQKIAKEERDARINKEMLSKAAEYKNIPGTPEEKAALLKSAYAASDDLGKQFEQSWKATNAQLDKAADGIFEPIGKQTSGDISVGTEVETRAAELRKDNPTMSREQAIAKVYEEDPMLYDKTLTGKE